MDKSKLVEAANYLIESDTYTATMREIMLIIRDWGTLQCRYSGERECLNALVELGLEDMGKLQRVVDLIDSRRKTGPSMRRTQYQAEYMAQRRARAAKAMQIEALVRGKPLSPDEKRDCDKRVHDAWAKRKQAFLTEQRAASYDDRLAATELFWEQIDRELEEQLQVAMAAPVVHRKAKRVVKVEHEPKTAFGKQIREALRR